MCFSGIFLTVVYFAAVPKTVNRIVGGEETTVENFPYMSNMQYNLFGFWWMQFCGGSVITNNLILSAAHCYELVPHQLQLMSYLPTLIMKIIDLKKKS